MILIIPLLCLLATAFSIPVPFTLLPPPSLLPSSSNISITLTYDLAYHVPATDLTLYCTRGDPVSRIAITDLLMQAQIKITHLLSERSPRTRLHGFSARSDHIAGSWASLKVSEADEGALTLGLARYIVRGLTILTDMRYEGFRGHGVKFVYVYQAAGLDIVNGQGELSGTQE